MNSQAAVASGSGAPLRFLNDADLYGALRKDFGIFRSEAKDIVAEFTSGMTK